MGFLLALFIYYMAFFRPQTVRAAENVIISEFLIDPTPQQIEIFNPTQNMIDISGWYVDDSGGTTYFTIPAASLLSPDTCLVFSGDFNLNKSSADTVRLFDSQSPPTSASAKLIDFFSYKSSSGSGIAFIRNFEDGSWSSASASLGLHNKTSLSCLPTILPEPSTTPSPSTPEVLSSPSPTLSYEKIGISEIMAYPAPGENEWVEVANDSDSQMVLNEWKVDDQDAGGSSPKTFSLSIPAHGLARILINSAILNNSGDIVRIIDPSGREVASVEFPQQTQNQSYGRNPENLSDYCFQQPSPDSPNNSCVVTEFSPTPTASPTPTPVPLPSPTRLVSPKIHTSSTSVKLSPTFPSPPTGEVLGIASPKTTLPMQKTLFGLTIFDSLLTAISLLTKMIIEYGKPEKIFSSPTHP